MKKTEPRTKMPWVLYKYLDGEYFSPNLVLIPQARMCISTMASELDISSWDRPLNLGLATTTNGPTLATYSVSLDTDGY